MLNYLLHKEQELEFGKLYIIFDSREDVLDVYIQNKTL